MGLSYFLYRVVCKNNTDKDRHRQSMISLQVVNLYQGIQFVCRFVLKMVKDRHLQLTRLFTVVNNQQVIKLKSFSRKILKYLDKMAPQQTRIYCKPAATVQKIWFQVDSHLNTIIFPNHLIEINISCIKIKVICYDGSLKQF